MKVPAIVWLMLGILLAVFSWFLGEDFVLFFYAGLIIVALGVFKFILGYVFSGKESSFEKKTLQQKEQYSKCSHCKSGVRKIDYFCSMCGKKLK